MNEECWSKLSYYLYITMSQKLLDAISRCSEKSKANIADFLKGLLSKEETDQKNKQNSRLMTIFNKQTCDFSLSKAREVSKGERNEKLLVGHQFNYGEITFETVETVFQKISTIRPPKTPEIFYDLGSGTGKVVLAAALCYPFQKCFGIEFLSTLWNFSASLREKTLKEKQQIETELSDIGNPIVEIPPIEFINADFKEVDWSDGTIIFVSSTCYSRQVMVEIEKLCFKLAAGTIIVTLTRKLEEAQGVSLVTSFEGSTSWGSSTIFIHMKNT